MYQIPNLRLVNHKLQVTDYLKAGWLRSPLEFTSPRVLATLKRA